MFRFFTLCALLGLTAAGLGSVTPAAADDAKPYSVYIPPEDQEAVRSAHEAWLRFNEAAEQIAAGNRKRLLAALDSRKQATRARRHKLRGKGQG